MPEETSPQTWTDGRLMHATLQDEIHWLVRTFGSRHLNLTPLQRQQRAARLRLDRRLSYAPMQDNTVTDPMDGVVYPFRDRFR